MERGLEQLYWHLLDNAKDSRTEERGNLWVELRELSDLNPPGWARPYYRRTGLYTACDGSAEELIWDLAQFAFSRGRSLGQTDAGSRGREETP